MTQGATILLAGGAGLALLGAVLLVNHENRLASTANPALDLGAQSALAGPAVGRQAAAERREEPHAGASAGDVGDPPFTFAFELECTVRDRDGLPVEDARLTLAPLGCALNSWSEPTAVDGSVLLHWHGKLPDMTMAVGLQGDVPQELQLVQVHAGAVQRLALLADGRQEDAAAQAPGVAGLPMREGLHPDATFGDLLLPAAKEDEPGTAPEADRLSRLCREYLAMKQLVAARRMDIRNAANVVPTRPADTGSLTGFVYDAGGRPVADVTVVWGTVVDQPAERTRTDKDGAFGFADVPNGVVALRAGGGETGLRHAQVPVNGATRCDLVLAEGAVIRGRALGPDGAPLAGCRVEYSASNTPWVAACSVREDGTFALHGLPEGRGRLLLLPHAPGVLPIAIEPCVQPDSEVLIDLARCGAPRGSLRLEAALPAGVMPLAAKARVWQCDSGRGVYMVADGEGALVLERLPAGFYRVEVGAVTSGWLDLGEHWVDGRGVCDVGRVALPCPGRVHVVLASSEVAITYGFYQCRPACDVRAEDAQAAQGGELLLAPGEWLCLWRQAGGSLHRQRFAVQPGGEVELTIGPPATSRR
jgi:Carboxypeptidase regulatory-like domain